MHMTIDEKKDKYELTDEEQIQMYQVYQEVMIDGHSSLQELNDLYSEE